MKTNKWKHVLLGALMMVGAVTFLNEKAEAATITVQPGQTLYELAKAHGTSVAAMKYTNHLQSDVIWAGQSLQMPFPYKVVSGDALSYLAKRYDTTVAAIQQVNHMERDTLFIGEVITIPVGKASARQPAAQTETASGLSVKAKVTQRTAQVSVSTPAPVHQTPTVAGMPYSHALQVVATAYGPGNIMWQWGGYTKMGTKVREGVIAVDPNLIPLGSKVWVTGYTSALLPAGGFVAKAEDTGGAIKGNRIDIYLDANRSQLLQFGMQTLKLYVLNEM